jgi:hypothetical protein
MKKKNHISGNVWVGLLMLMAFLITVGVALVSDAIVSLSQSKRQAQLVVAQTLADGGIDRAIWKMNKTGGTYGGENDLSVPQVNPVGQIDIAIAPDPNDSFRQLVMVKSYIPSKQNAKVMRQVRASISSMPDQDNVSFHYAVQVGAGGLNMNPNSVINGTVYSNGNVTGAGTINSDTYAVTTITGVTVPAPYHTYPNSPTQPMPAINVEAWKREANVNNDPITGDKTVTSGTFGYKRINGNCTFSNITVTGPIYCTGSISLSGTINILPDYKSNGTVVLADGVINDNGATVNDTGYSPKGFIMFITTSNDYNAAITLSNWSRGGVFLANYGGVTINPHTHPVIISGYRFNMQPNSDLTCDAGLGSASFVNGPGGSWMPKEYSICKITPNENVCHL